MFRTTLLTLLAASVSSVMVQQQGSLAQIKADT